MDIYQQYALNKAKIKDLQDECKALEEQLGEAVRKEGEPIKKDYGTFMFFKRRSYEYSAKLNAKIESIEKEKEVEEIKGVAVCTEKEFFKFTPSKYAMPKQAYHFPEKLSI